MDKFPERPPITTSSFWTKYEKVAGAIKQLFQSKRMFPSCLPDIEMAEKQLENMLQGSNPYSEHPPRLRWPIREN
jgi:hypothetical protein